MSQQDFFIFCACNALLLNYNGYESDENDVLATGGVTTFVHLCTMYICVKCDITDFCC